jgi:Glycosyl hydrolases family 35
MLRRLDLLILALLFVALSIGPAQRKPEPGAFTAGDGQFLLNGKPFRIISGEMHYARIPRAYWRDRFRMAKAMGLNAVTTYVFWNVHEPRPGVYDFSGNLDVAEFIHEAQQEGLYVILRPDEVHDYAQIYLDGRSIGSLDRRLGQNHLVIKIPAAGARLDILVENSGRINFSLVLRGERKGITKQVALAGKPVLGWDIYSLPMTDLPVNSPLKNASCVGPCFFLGAIFVDKQADTFFDTSAFTKGALWFGRPQPLGRIWNIGPQQTLYAPGPFFLSSRGFQGVVVFEMNAHELPYTLTGLDQPILDKPAGH